MNTSITHHGHPYVVFQHETPDGKKFGAITPDGEEVRGFGTYQAAEAAATEQYENRQRNLVQQPA